jgi:hypothetical protein
MEVVRRMYQRAGGTSNDFAALGIPMAAGKSFAPESTCDIWPENLPAFQIFADLSTQWRVGMAGPTGLDYPAVLAVMDLHGTAPEHRRERFDELRVMERAALSVMAEDAKAKS